MFDNMVESLSYTTTYGQITKQEFEEFERCWIMYALQEKRYGQAFIEHFNFSKSSTLYRFEDDSISKDWIQRNYKIV